jgi:hypothetical protein
VSLGGNNALALYNFSAGMSYPPTLAGLIPTGWYPGFIAVDGERNQIDVVNVRGLGVAGPPISRGPDPATNRTGKVEVNAVGFVSQIDVPNQIVAASLISVAS